MRQKSFSYWVTKVQFKFSIDNTCMNLFYVRFYVWHDVTAAENTALIGSSNPSILYHLYALVSLVICSVHGPNAIYCKILN